jgi:hypothetical protein
MWPHRGHFSEAGDRLAHFHHDRAMIADAYPRSILQRGAYYKATGICSGRVA